MVRWKTLLVLAFATATCASAAAERVLMDEIVAVIDGGIITVSDILAARELASATGRSILPADQLLGGDPKQVNRNVLKEILIGNIAYTQAVKLNMAEADPAAIERDYQQLRARFSSEQEYNAFLSPLGLLDEHVLFRLRKHRICERFLSKKIGLQVRIGLKAYYQENRARYPDVPFDQIKDRVAADLFVENLDDWIAESLTRVDLKILHPDYADLLK